MNTPLNFQPKITLGGFGIESIPFTNWRETLAKDGTVQYQHEISGNAVVECEDGRMRSIQVELRIYGKKRFSGLGGIVTQWHPRPSRGKTHAQCKTVTLRDGSTAFDGPVQFAEPEIATPTGPVSPELGLVYKADLAKGKTLAIAGAELKAKFDNGNQVIGKDGTLYYVVTHNGGVSVEDRPAVADLGDDDSVPVSAEGVSVRAAARRSGGSTAAPVSDAAAPAGDAPAGTGDAFPNTAV